MEKQDEIEKLKKECDEFCKKHPLYKQGTFPVFGEGSLNAEIMLIGEAPGYNESITGKPFCGAAGKILDEILNNAGLKREDIFITNVVKMRPPNNRNPTKEEINHFSPFLDNQIKILNPKIIGTLGNFSTAYIMEKFNLKDKIQGISKIHGQVFNVSTLFNVIKIVPLYHPAVATYNANMKDTLKEDFLVLKKILGE
ncbi:MAG: uracil-DNA glycosylase [Candidatus Nanoarchaeia archaeon]|nr:uracil-DNA glycosylase [Candidatus Nanoarchaeia archaeon]